jgi:Family of unknown function (DUF5677)
MTSYEDFLRTLLRAFEARVRNDLRLRCEGYAPDLEAPEVFNVLTALLARQATLAIELSLAPPLWNQHSAPLFLRAMADVHITLAWLLLDAKKRVRAYVEHGLGQAVLELEHLKKLAAPENDSDQSTMKVAIEREQNWIDMQKWNFLVEVNVGAWSGKTTREMAEQADILDFYNQVYMPFSQCAHSTWSHVGRYNSSPSDSPLTRLLWIARVPDVGVEPEILSLAAKYLDKSFNVFDVSALKRPESSEIQKWLNQQLDSFDDPTPDEPVGGSL